MLAGRLRIRDRALELTDVPEPHAGPGQVRIRVRAAGVCLSDVHLVDGSLSPLHLRADAVTLGHEVAGEVDEVGDGVTTAAVGDRVLLQAGELAPNGRDVLTRGVDYDGGWAEHAVARADTVVPIPDSLPFEQACFIPDAVSTPWAAVTATARVRAGQAVGVWGVGGLGAHGVALLRLVGAAPVVAVDPLPAARERALAYGADVALDPADPGFAAAMTAATGGRGLAAAFDFAGAAAVRAQASACLGYEGRLVLVGLSHGPLEVPDSTAFSYLKRQVLGHYGSVPGDLPVLVRLVELGRLDLSRSVSAVLPLAQADEAVRMLADKTGDPVRLVLQP